MADALALKYPGTQGVKGFDGEVFAWRCLYPEAGPGVGPFRRPACRVKVTAKTCWGWKPVMQQMRHPMREGRRVLPVPGPASTSRRGLPEWEDGSHLRPDSGPGSPGAGRGGSGRRTFRGRRRGLRFGSQKSRQRY